MAYVELRYYQSYVLEIREFGDSGWAVHVYTPGTDRRPKKLTIVTTTSAVGIQRVLTEARTAVNNHLKKRQPAPRHASSRPASVAPTAVAAPR